MKILWLQGFPLQLGWGGVPPISQKVTKSPPIRVRCHHHKNYKNFKQQNKSIFLGDLYKTFCLWCTFLQELVIHNHGGLLLAEKFLVPAKILEISAVIIACCCWSLPICKKSNLLFWITLDTSDHFHLNWLKVLILLLPCHMQKTNFTTQLILEIKLTHYLLSFWACSGMPERTHLKQPPKI